MSKKLTFQEIYPFTTENTSYIAEMDVKDKNVLTVGSSCDQAFNILLLGAKEVTVFDINERVMEFYELKRKLILEVAREQLVEQVMNIKGISYFEDAFTANQLERMNLYLQNDENYNKLRNILESKTVEFITGNIFDSKGSLSDSEQYDRVILSNVLQYLPKSDIQVEQKVYQIYNDLSCYLSEDAIVQLYYLYGNLKPANFIKIINEFDKNGLIFERVSCDKNDSVVLVKKGPFIK